MTNLTSKSGITVTTGALEEAGLALAFNLDSFFSKLEKVNGNETWRVEAEKLINKTHSVLAQIDLDEKPFDLEAESKPSVQMLNAGGILTLVDEQDQPLGFMMVKSEKGLQLGFGKVELKDLHEDLTDLQTKFDLGLRANLLDILATASSKKDFKDKVAALVTDVEKLSTFCQPLQGILSLLLEKDAKTQSCLSKINTPETPSFAPRNPYAARAQANAAQREVSEEIKFTLKGVPVTPDRIKVIGVLSREKATAEIRYLLSSKFAAEEVEKFSAKEKNENFNSATHTLQCKVSSEEFAELVCDKDCLLVTPTAMRIEVTNLANGFFNTVLDGYPPINGGGNQFMVALYCANVFGLAPTLKLLPKTESAAAAASAGLFSVTAYQQQLNEIVLNHDVVKASKDPAQKLVVASLFKLVSEIFAQKNPAEVDYAQLAMQCIHAAWIECFRDKTNRIDPTLFMAHAQDAIMRIKDLDRQTEMTFFHQYVQSTVTRNSDQFPAARAAAERAVATCGDNDEIKAHCLMQLALALLRNDQTEEARSIIEKARSAAINTRSLTETQCVTNNKPVFQIITDAEGSAYDRVHLNLMQIEVKLKDFYAAALDAEIISAAADQRIAGKPDDVNWAYTQMRATEVFLLAAANSEKIDLLSLVERQQRAFKVYVPDPHNPPVTFNAFRCALATAQVFYRTENFAAAEECISVANNLIFSGKLNIYTHFLETLLNLNEQMAARRSAVPSA